MVCNPSGTADAGDGTGETGAVGLGRTGDVMGVGGDFGVWEAIGVAGAVFGAGTATGVGCITTAGFATEGGVSFAFCICGLPRNENTTTVQHSTKPTSHTA